MGCESEGLTQVDHFLVSQTGCQLWLLQQLCQEILSRRRLEKALESWGARGDQSWEEGPEVPMGNVLLLRWVGAEPGQGRGGGQINPGLASSGLCGLQLRPHFPEPQGSTL